MELLKRKREAFALITTGVIAALLYIQKQTLQFDIQEAKELIISFGILAPIAFVAINVLTIIISPLSSFPLWLASLGIYGFTITFILIVISHIIGSIVNFLIARHFGRPIIKKLAGDNSLDKIDEMSHAIGLKTLFLARLVGGAATDYISYAAGLTSIRLKPYAIISSIVPLPMIFFNVYILDKAIQLQPIYFIALGILSYIIAVSVPFVTYKYALHKDQNKQTKK